jgi:hypothetical protein
MSGRMSWDAAKYVETVNAMASDFLDRCMDQFGEDAGLDVAPLILGGIIGAFHQRIAGTDETDKLVSDINQALERTGMPYRLRPIV